MLQRAMALALFIPALVCLGVAMGIFDISVLAYGRCIRCPRTEIPTMWTVRLLGLMFALFAIAMLGESSGKKSTLTSATGAVAWLLFCGLLLRQAVYSDFPVSVRVVMGTLSVLFLLCFVLGWLWFAVSRRRGLAARYGAAPESPAVQLERQP